ncbi:kinase-like protein [Xylariaceae sp. FL1651]|nr:kinase-like protein [Xylariaceae sp. FL1651]
MSSSQPIAQIFCRLVMKRHPACVGPGKGFIYSPQAEEHIDQEPCPSIDFLLFPNQVIHVGRCMPDNDVTIHHPYVSRDHFMIYSIVYEGDGDAVQPLVYVRDCGSLWGTYVDDHSTRPRKLPSPLGYLLSQGEVIRLKPYWEFHVHLLGSNSSSSPADQLRLGEIDLFRDRYLVTERLLGSGGLAAVHLAVNLKLGKQVACKIHHLDRFRQFQNSPSTIRRILEETNILARLSHPNLLKFEAAFRSPDTLYTFTELATGGDLFSMRVRYPDGLPEMDAKIIVRQILSAVGYLHKQNIAHRDLKPENVFFATGPSPMARVIVGDLGFAKVAASGRMASHIGTKIEVYRGQSYGIEVDIWSIGMISLFLVALDWNSLGLLESFDQSAVDEGLKCAFEVLYEEHKALSHSFRDFIRSCLVVEPPRRMTADSCKRHRWFRSSRSQLEAKIAKFKHQWNPPQLIFTPVEDLDLLESASTRRQKYVVYSDQGMTPDDKEIIENSQTSHYFMDHALIQPKEATNLSLVSNALA